nr:MAG TPA: hypothetical protein [Caudoviricetes sp.]
MVRQKEVVYEENEIKTIPTRHLAEWGFPL